MLQNPCKTLGLKKNMVHKIPPGGGGKPYPASGLKALAPSSYDLYSRGGRKTKIQQLSVDLDPRLPFMCYSRDFRQGMVGASSLSFFFCLQTVRTQVWPDRSKLSETLTVFLIFSIKTKAPIRPVVPRLVWAFVVPMYQRRISRDKVHTIFKNSKLNVKI